MKRAFRILVPILLVLTIIFGTLWYFFVYDREFTRDILLSAARYFENRGNHGIATWFYDRAYDHADDADSVAIELAQQYIKSGNYTQAERTLSAAISDNSTLKLYVALCQTYVAQDKILDAVQLLNNIRNVAILEELDDIRPQAPTSFPAPGLYSQYIDVTVKAESGTLYVNPSKEYPSVYEDLYEKPITLVSGENAIYAVAISEDGIVSPLSVFGYTVGGIIERVEFHDSAVENAIRSALNVGSDEILYSDALWDIKSFTVPANVSSFADLSHLLFVENLTIDGGPSGQLEFLDTMTCLTNLTICNVSITPEELSKIGQIQTLSSLTLSNCRLSTTSGLENAVNLTNLDLSNNTIRNLSALSALKQLTTLNLQHNAVISLDALAASSNLASLNISHNTVSDLSPITTLASLTALNASNNHLSSLPKLSGLANLEELNLSYNMLTGVYHISECISLKNLDISNNELTDISALATMTSLINLNFSTNQVTEIPSFPTDCALITIDGSSNDITSLKPLSGLENLNNVLMDFNKSLSSLSVLSKCPRLSKVSVYGTKVSSSDDLRKQGIVVYYDKKY